MKYNFIVPYINRKEYLDKFIRRYTIINVDFKLKDEC